MRRGSPAVTRWTTAALVAVSVTGYLLVSGVLDPVLGEAITLAQGKDHPAKTASGLKVGKVADWQYFDDRPEWSSVRGVPQVPGPADPVEPVRPGIAPPENPIHFFFSGPAPMPHYTLQPMGSCPQPRGPAMNVPNFVVTVGTGSATATWWDLGDPDTQNYTLSAVPESVNEGNGTRAVVQPLIVSTTIAAPHACKQVTATISGLTSGATYYLVLQGNNLSPTQNRPYGVTRAQSGSIVIG